MWNQNEIESHCIVIGVNRIALLAASCVSSMYRIIGYASRCLSVMEMHIPCLMRLENTWQEIRDQSFIQNHSRLLSSMLVLLLFSSPHSFSTGFRSEDWNGHSKSLVLCTVTYFCVVFEVCVWIIVRLEDLNMAHYKIYNRVSHLLICWYLIKFMMPCI